MLGMCSTASPEGKRKAQPLTEIWLLPGRQALCVVSPLSPAACLLACSSCCAWFSHLEDFDPCLLAEGREINRFHTEQEKMTFVMKTIQKINMTMAAEWKLISKDSDKIILKMENTTVFFVLNPQMVIVNKTGMNTIMFIIAKYNNNKLPSL